MKSKMFPFNKPKVYRSSEGCCICRAKTSSSRFIESKKYEKDAVKCFLLDHPRKGEICNACVLLVKRFKRLPDGSNKNWGHVVDTRSGVIATSTTKPSTTNATTCVTTSPITTPTSTSTPIPTLTTIYTSTTTPVSSSKSSSSSSSLLPEKFAKIFKKTTKKSKSSHSSKSGGGDSNKMGAHSKKSSRVTAAHHHHHHHSYNNNNYELNHNSQITTVASSESMAGHGDDCEDSHYTVPSSANLQNGNIVEFQTETRASYRARKSSSSSSLKTNAINAANAIADLNITANGGQGRRRPLTKMGCKRRKCFMPRKRQKLWDEEEIKKEFYDTNEWLPKKTCCGIIYECTLFKQSIMLKTEEFKPCLEHSIKKESVSSSVSSSAAIQQIKRETAIVTGIQRPIATVPAIVQIQTQPNQISQNQVQIQQIQSNMPTTLLPPPPPQIQHQHQHQQQQQTQIQLHHQVQNQQQSTPPAQPPQQHQQQQQQPSVNVIKQTQPLKKHHLYFKRQSECFPHGDINIHNNNNNNNTPMTPIKNETTVPMTTTTVPNIIPPVKIETTYPQTSTIVFSSSSSAAVVAAAASISSASSSSSYSTMTLAPSTYVSTPASTIHTNAIITPTTYMPRHSSAKVTTISTSHSSSLQIPINSTAPTYTSHSSNNTTSSKSQQMLHKIKPESGKIVKHSLEKLNSTVRIKPSDLQDMKHVIKTVDKSYVLTKPTTTITPLNTNIINNNNNNNTTTGHLQYHQALNAATAAASATTISTGASSPSSVSSTSSSSTKYSDNSSDSGFDENMLDRKSASPLQEDTERKILTRPGLQTMFLSSGVQIQGQHQNIVLTGNEVAAKVMQNRKASTITVTPAPHTTKIGTNGATIMHHHQAHPNNGRPATSVASGTTSAVKIAQIIGTNSMQAANSLQTTISGGSHVAKMRAIYNNNTIQHENGITTIVPASSLAATTQTAAMNAIPPNTVTITPAPVQHGKKIITNTGATITATNYQNQQHIQNIIATNSTTTINPVISAYSIHQQQQQQQHHHQQQQQQQQHQHQQQTHLHGANINHQIGGNQKIILLKTSNGGGLGGCTTTTTATKYNTNAIINNNTQNLINKGLLTANNIQTVTVPSAATLTAQNSLNSLNVQTTTTSHQNTIIKARP